MIKSSFQSIQPLDISSDGKEETKSFEYTMRAMLISYSNPKSILFLSVNESLAEYQWHYNHYRPHDGVGLETPMGYYQKLMQAA